MVELLTQALREGCIEDTILLHRGARTLEGFEEAWTVAWRTMIVQRSFPHRKEPKQEWTDAVEGAKGEFKAAYLRRSSPFSRLWPALRARIDSEDEALHPADNVVPAELVA